MPFRYEISEVIGGMAVNKLVELRTHIEERKKNVSKDQRHRYPTDVDGKPWDGAFGFEPTHFWLLFVSCSKFTRAFYFCSMQQANIALTSLWMLHDQAAQRRLAYDGHRIRVILTLTVCIHKATVCHAGNSQN